MRTLIDYLANEITGEPRMKAIAGQLQSELNPVGALEIFFVAEIVRALLHFEVSPEAGQSDRAKIMGEIRRNTAELRRLRADRPKNVVEPHEAVAVESGSFPSEAIDASSEITKQTQSVPRGARCPCGSGQKYKRCCGLAAPPQYNFS